MRLLPKKLKNTFQEKQVGELFYLAKEYSTYLHCNQSNAAGSWNYIAYGWIALMVVPLCPLLLSKKKYSLVMELYSVRLNNTLMVTPVPSAPINRPLVLD